MNQQHTKYLVLGGGISAVSFAHYLKDDDYIILEKEKTLGGLCRSFHVGKSTFDFSGHFLHFKNPEMEEYVKKLVNTHQTGEFKQYFRDAGIFMKNQEEKIIDYPFQANIHQLDKETFINCLSDLYSASVKKEHNNLDIRTFNDLVRLNFGDTITDIFFKPYNEKLYRTALDKMDVNAMRRFIPTASFDEVMQNIKEKKNFGYNSTFLYSPTSGIQGLVDAFIKEKPVNALLNEEIVLIDLDNKKVITSTGLEITYEYLINTLPLPVFIKLARLQPIELKSVDVDVYNITYTKDVVIGKKKAWLYFPDNSPFYRVGFYNYMSGNDNTSIYVEVSRLSNSNTTVYSIDDIHKELINAGVITSDAVIQDRQYLEIAPAYAVLEPTTEANVLELKNQLAWDNVYFTGRYGTWNYQSIEDNILDAKTLAEEFNHK